MDNLLKLQKYEGLFHDGALWAIQQAKSKIKLLMESAEVIPEWNEDNIILSKRDRISGKLVLEDVKSINENDTYYLEEFQVEDSYDRGEVFRLRVQPNKICLFIIWIKYFPDYEESSVFKYEIEAEKIYWENIPTMFDAYWDSL